MKGIVLCISFIALAACRQASAGSSDSGGASDTVTARATVQKLEREAKALAHTEGCSGAGQCRMAPAGNRPCGGPRLYIPYCSATTDSAAFFRKLDELKAADEKLNQLLGIAGTCQMRMPPIATLTGGRCGP